MKKIAIITITGYFNYGNRLQNYALQEVLKSYGFTVDTIRVGKDVESKKKRKNILGKILKIRNKSLKELLSIIASKIWGKFQTNKIKHFNKIRTKSFKEFTQEYINETDYYISEENIPKDLTNQYDFFVVGSDQVWNPYFNLEKPIYFLDFVPQQKRISYAPSFGVTELPEKYVDKYKKGLLGFNQLSIREKSGAALIKKLIDKDASVLVDPTMLLDKEEWLKIVKEPKVKPKVQFILNYFLGKVKKEDRKIIKKIARKYKLKIIDLVSINDKNNYIIGPDEFVKYINLSKIIFTDSFHCTIFSILFEKPFVIFERYSKGDYSMESRFDALLSIFNLESRRFSNIKNICDIFNVDYRYSYNILERERQKAKKYLENVLINKRS